MATYVYENGKKVLKKASVEMPIGIMGTKEYEKAVERAKLKAIAKENNPKKNVDGMSDEELSNYRYDLPSNYVLNYGLDDTNVEDPVFRDRLTGEWLSINDITTGRTNDTSSYTYQMSKDRINSENRKYAARQGDNAFIDAYKNYGATGQKPFNGLQVQGASIGNTNPYLTEADHIRGEYERQAELQRRLIAKQVAQGVRRYESEKEGVNQDYDEAARQAYIAYMQQGRQMPQQLVARGISGGGAETANLGLRVGYENNRNAIEMNRANAIGSIDNAIAELQNSGDIQATQQALELYKQQIAAEAQAREKAFNEQIATIGQYGNDFMAEIQRRQAINPNDPLIPYLVMARQQKIEAQKQAEAQALIEAQKQANLDRNYYLDYLKTMYDINRPYATPKENKPDYVSYSTVKGIIDNNYISKDPLTGNAVVNKNAVADYIERESDAGRLSDNDRTSLLNYYGIEDIRPYKQAVAQKLLQNGATEQAVLQFLNDRTVTADVLKQMLAQ